MGHRVDLSETAEFHWRSFIDFARYELAAGGPDPHMRVIGYLCRDLPVTERVWCIGCYVAVYNVPSAELLWTNWRLEDALFDQPVIEEWLRAHWRGLRLRRERRPVKSSRKLAEFLNEYARWAVSAPVPRSYEELWESVNGIRYVGRYAAIKLAETLWRYAGYGGPMADLRPSGAWSIKLALAYLYPQHAEYLQSRETAALFSDMNALGEEARNRLSAALGLQLDTYHTEVLLCDYKQAWDGRQYPGRSQDSELDYYQALASYWEGYTTRLLEARSALFPKAVLGEHGGWGGVRKPLTEVLKTHKYTWSDLLFDYSRSVADLGRPVPRNGRETNGDIAQLVRARALA